MMYESGGVSRDELQLVGKTLRNLEAQLHACRMVMSRPARLMPLDRVPMELRKFEFRQRQGRARQRGADYTRAGGRIDERFLAENSPEEIGETGGAVATPADATPGFEDLVHA